MRSVRNVILGVSTLVLVIIIGVFGYSIIEGWSLFDSLYMTAMTITTVGYKELYPLSSGGRAFSIFLMFGGVGAALTSCLNTTLFSPSRIKILIALSPKRSSIRSFPTQWIWASNICLFNSLIKRPRQGQTTPLSCPISAKNSLFQANL